jgi:hypothetical protein
VNIQKKNFTNFKGADIEARTEMGKLKIPAACGIFDFDKKRKK